MKWFLKLALVVGITWGYGHLSEGAIGISNFYLDALLTIGAGAAIIIVGVVVFGSNPNEPRDIGFRFFWGLACLLGLALAEVVYLSLMTRQPEPVFWFHATVLASWALTAIGITFGATMSFIDNMIEPRDFVAGAFFLALNLGVCILALYLPAFVARSLVLPFWIVVTLFSAVRFAEIWEKATRPVPTKSFLPEA